MLSRGWVTLSYMGLTREQMLDRMAANDASYDGVFVVGVHSTGIYCLPSCRARPPKPQNVHFYETIEQAREVGLRACKKCRPDEFTAGIDPELDRLRTALIAVRTEPGRFRGIDDLAHAVAMSSSTLFAATRHYYGTTPGALLAQSRIRSACLRLRESNEPVGEVGLTVGFETSSAFYENFRRRTGMPPAAYRRLAGSRAFTLELPGGMPLGHLLHYLARDPEGTTERSTDDGFELGLWAGQTPCHVEVRLKGNEAFVTLHGDGDLDTFSVHGQLVRLFNLSADPKPFEDHLRSVGRERLFHGREGMRIPQSPRPFDGLVWSIVGQQVNLAFAATLRRRLTEIAGTPIGNGMYAPPTPASVAALTVASLMPHQFSARKAEYLIGAAREIMEGRLDLETLAEAPMATMEATLRAIRGIGPWSANYLMMRALGAPDCVPLGDTGLTSALSRFFDVPRPNAEETLALMEPFRPYRSLATYHLWQSLHLEP